MLFNSLSFLIFFPLVTVGYFLVPQKVKVYWLLGASYYFYLCWNPAYTLLLLFVTAASYTFSRLYEKAKSAAGRKWLLAANLLACLGGLFLFKYLGFFSNVLSTLLLQVGVTATFPAFDFVAVGGISFYTFQALGYAIDVYREKIPAEKNAAVYALFVSFFPIILSGPIERGSELIPQLKQAHSFEYQRVCDGLFTMLWGFFKKMVIADGAAAIVNVVYKTPGDFGGAALILATVLFAFQIYCDFSGYSDIAIGAAQVMGFSLSENFRAPYLSASIQEFWNRWHISLSHWFRDYLYIPLGGSRKGLARTCRNLLVTFLVSGLWHGASWTYILWGALHGLYSVAGRLSRPLRSKATALLHLDAAPHLKRAFGVIFTFSLVCISWVFFKSSSVQDAFYVLTHLGVGLSNLFTHAGFLQTALDPTGFFTKNGPVLCGCIAMLIGADVWQSAGAGAPLARKVRSRPFYIRWPIYYGLLLLILYFGNFGQSQFIYLQY